MEVLHLILVNVITLSALNALKPGMRTILPYSTCAWTSRDLSTLISAARRKTRASAEVMTIVTGPTPREIDVKIDLQRPHADQFPKS